jgi:diphthine-ammonia ligase
MIKYKMKSILVKTASMGLYPNKYLGKTIEEMEGVFKILNKSSFLNICGEGGEYETLTLNCPIFKKEIVM